MIGKIIIWIWNADGFRKQLIEKWFKYLARRCVNGEWKCGISSRRNFHRGVLVECEGGITQEEEQEHKHQEAEVRVRVKVQMYVCVSMKMWELQRAFSLFSSLKSCGLTLVARLLLSASASSRVRGDTPPGSSTVALLHPHTCDTLSLHTLKASSVVPPLPTLFICREIFPVVRQRRLLRGI